MRPFHHTDHATVSFTLRAPAASRVTPPPNDRRTAESLVTTQRS
ncbi:hypothetical protein D187_008099 [Cystobacter fuscus DSM 2262]|uniref:Uncharacterized protein n=1 Tax=Cystobacter fuscus (strain ATCC 25194 / DSM 2262 / NBRC 100088 / M29) TaxID=1242864 RepID=S9P3B6_CYSF2|nr:hypothetical protein D187_008099 [Cystobacter fuscus DSM 2262]